MYERGGGGGGDQLILYVQSSSLMKAQKTSILASYWYWKLVLILNPLSSCLAIYLFGDFNLRNKFLVNISFCLVQMEVG